MQEEEKCMLNLFFRNPANHRVTYGGVKKKRDTADCIAAERKAEPHPARAIVPRNHAGEGGIPLREVEV
jgi:hypothetical protein